MTKAEQELEVIRKVLKVTGHDKTSASVACEIANNFHTYVAIWPPGTGKKTKQTISTWGRLSLCPPDTVRRFYVEIDRAP